MVLNATFKKKLESVLRKFKLNEFHALVASIFPGTTIEDIDLIIKKLRLPVTPRFVAKILSEIYEHKAPTIDNCDKTLIQLYLFDVIFHDKNAWSVAELVNNVHELPDKLSDLDRAICRGYRSKALNANVVSVLLKDIVWSVVAEKIILKKGGVRMGSPNFFVFKPDLDVPHILFSPKNMERDLHLQIYIESLGYKEYTMVEFEGFNAVSMFGCIERKSKNSTSLIPHPDFQSSGEIAVFGNNFNDYSFSHEIEKYANQVFTGLSNHTQITVECEDLYDRPSSSSTIGDFFSTMTFVTKKKKTVEMMFKSLVCKHAVEFPLPSYMLSLSSTPSNVMNVEPNSNIRVSIGNGR